MWYKTYSEVQAFLEAEERLPLPTSYGNEYQLAMWILLQESRQIWPDEYCQEIWRLFCKDKALFFAARNVAANYQQRYAVAARRIAAMPVPAAPVVAVTVADLVDNVGTKRAATVSDSSGDVALKRIKIMVAPTPAPPPPTIAAAIPPTSSATPPQFAPHSTSSNSSLTIPATIPAAPMVDLYAAAKAAERECISKHWFARFEALKHFIATRGCTPRWASGNAHERAVANWVDRQNIHCRNKSHNMSEPLHRNIWQNFVLENAAIFRKAPRKELAQIVAVDKQHPDLCATLMPLLTAAEVAAPLPVPSLATPTSLTIAARLPIPLPAKFAAPLRPPLPRPIPANTAAPASITSASPPSFAEDIGPCSCNTCKRKMRMQPRQPRSTLPAATLRTAKPFASTHAFATAVAAPLPQLSPQQRRTIAAPSLEITERPKRSAPPPRTTAASLAACNLINAAKAARTPDAVIVAKVPGMTPPLAIDSLTTTMTSASTVVITTVVTTVITAATIVAEPVTESVVTVEANESVRGTIVDADVTRRVATADRQWFARFAELKEFMAVHGRKPTRNAIAANNDQERILSNWISTQQQHCKDETYCMEDPARRAIWQLFVSEHANMFAAKCYTNWDDSFAKVKAFVAVNHRLPLRISAGDGDGDEAALARWCYLQDRACNTVPDESQTEITTTRCQLWRQYQNTIAQELAAAKRNNHDWNVRLRGAKYFIISQRRLPAITSDDGREKLLALWLAVQEHNHDENIKTMVDPLRRKKWKQFHDEVVAMGTSSPELPRKRARRI